MSHNMIECRKHLAHTDLTTISSLRGCETLLGIERVANVSSCEISYAFHPVKPHPISVRGASYAKLAILDKLPLTHDLARRSRTLARTCCRKRERRRSGRWRQSGSG